MEESNFVDVGLGKKNGIVRKRKEARIRDMDIEEVSKKQRERKKERETQRMHKEPKRREQYQDALNVKGKDTERDKEL